MFFQAVLKDMVRPLSQIGRDVGIITSKGCLQFRVSFHVPGKKVGDKMRRLGRLKQLGLHRYIVNLQRLNEIKLDLYKHS